MQQKIQELTNQIFREGVEKGEQKATEIVAQAQAQAEKIVADAKEAAETILADAQKQAEELRRNVESEIRLASSTALSAIRQQIIDLVLAKVIEKPITGALLDAPAVGKMIAELVRAWSESSKQSASLEILLPEEKRAEFTMALKSSIGDLLSKGVSLKFTKNIKAGFQIAQRDTSYKISFTDDDFAEFFKEAVRQQTREFLFGK